MEKVGGIPLFSLRNKSEVEKLGFDTSDILEILISTGEGIEKLHQKANIFIGDLNGRNILFDKDKKVYFLDFDGMGVESLSPEFFTDGYVDPVSKNNGCITIKDDWYSFAIQAFYYLTYTHPFNGIYKKDKKLDIVEKMERKLSLLGNHNMTPPKIAKSWDNMNKDLKKAFLNTFEGDYRESIVPFLLKEYDLINNNQININENNKFIIEETSLFDLKSDIAEILDNYRVDGIENIIVNDNLVFCIYEDEIVVRNKSNSYNEVFSLEVSEVQYFDINDNVLYYVDIIDGENVIVKNEILEDDNVKCTLIKFKSDLITKGFGVWDNSKFIIVKRDLEGNDIIYCNDMEYHIIEKNLTSEEYQILYDEFSKKWIVIGSNGMCIIIFPDMKNQIIKQEKILETNLFNIVFSKENIYIPLDGYLYIYSIKREISKEISCNISVDSTFEITSNGFKFINDNKLYEYTLK